MLQSYPEFCRATFDLAPDNFLTICAELEKAYGVVSHEHSYLHSCYAKTCDERVARNLHVHACDGAKQCWAAFHPTYTAQHCMAVTWLEVLVACLQPASRKYILLYLWEAREGGGVVSSKLILGSARRLRVT